MLTDINAHAAVVQTMLVTEYINPNIAEQLKEPGFQFLDTAGNVFINQLPVYVDIQGKTVVNTKALLDKWLDAYPANMHAKLNQTLFATDNPEQLKAINTAEFDGYWGGEFTAERYDHYLKTKDFLIYLEPERKQAFFKRC